MANETMSAMPLSGNIPASLSALLSISALGEWLKLLLVGGAIEFCRRSFSGTWEWMIELFWFTLTLDEDDACYDWMLFWLSRQPAWNEARRVEVTTRSFGVNSLLSGYLYDDDDGDTRRRMSYIPSVSTTYSMWYKGCYMTFSRTSTPDGYTSTKEILNISILTRNNTIISQLISESKKTYKAAQEKVISIHVCDTNANWRHVMSRPKRPLSSIILDPGIKELLLNDARDFLDSEEWYIQRGIPFRRGYLLYGAPGTGKTSMIQSIAGELGLDVYILTLSKAGLDDSGLNELISDLPKRCIALMEDIDAVFHRGVSRSTVQDPGRDAEKMGKSDGEKSDELACRISLSGLLNALDGIAAQEGRILFATTNAYTTLDPALRRPGRMDIHVEFQLASKYQAEQLFKCFYIPTKRRRSRKVDPEDEKVTDSGFGSRAPSVDRDLIRWDDATPAEHVPSSVISGESAESMSLSSESAHPRGALLSPAQTSELATQFADAIPDREFSMAALQGYLMMYKIRPYQAVRDAPAWVARERAARQPTETSSS